MASIRIQEGDACPFCRHAVRASKRSTWMTYCPQERLFIKDESDEVWGGYWIFFQYSYQVLEHSPELFLSQDHPMYAEHEAQAFKIAEAQHEQKPDRYPEPDFYLDEDGFLRSKHPRNDDERFDFYVTSSHRLVSVVPFHLRYQYHGKITERKNYDAHDIEVPESYEHSSSALLPIEWTDKFLGGQLYRVPSYIQETEEQARALAKVWEVYQENCATIIKMLMVAGSGKSSMIWWLIRGIFGLQNKRTTASLSKPLAKNKALVLSYNTHNAESMHKHGVPAVTVHALGRKIILEHQDFAAARTGSFSPETKLRDVVEEVVPVEISHRADLVRGFTELASRCSDEMFIPWQPWYDYRSGRIITDTREAIDLLTDQYGIEPLFSYGVDVIDLLTSILERTIETAKERLGHEDIFLIIASNEEIFQSVTLMTSGSKTGTTRWPRLEILFFDEAQDANPARFVTAMAAAGYETPWSEAAGFSVHPESNRRIFISLFDPFQSIYTWNGAMVKIGEVHDLTSEVRDTGFYELRIDTSQRCCQAVAPLAQRVVPHFKVRNDAPIGHQGTIEYDEYETLMEQAAYEPELAETITVLARTNAELVVPMYRAIMRGAKVKYQGKHLLTQVEKVISGAQRNMRRADWGNPDSPMHIGAYLIQRAEEKMRKADKAAKRRKAQQDYEIAQAIANLAQESQDDMSKLRFILSELLTKISGQEGNLTFSTIHSYKGRENETIILVGTDLIPHPMSFEPASALREEVRLLYVAVTRAKVNMYFLEMHPTWLDERSPPAPFNLQEAKYYGLKLDYYEQDGVFEADMQAKLAARLREQGILDADETDEEQEEVQEDAA